MKRSLFKCALIFTLAITTTGCAKLGYYTQAINGHLEILTNREPINALLEDPDTKPALKAQLASILEMRTFATEELGLPDNRSYRTYVDLNRPYAVWNVFAAPEFSLEPLEWCFAFVGCVSYRGYFSPKRAQRFGNTLAKKNHDVYVVGVAAYSTLGWFHDPVLSTILGRPETEVASLIFHELAHQVVYVQNDTAFNESFAVTVEREGVRRWLARKGATAQFERYLLTKRRREDFVNLIMGYRQELQELYGSDRSDVQKRAAKAKAFDDLRNEYRKLKKSWGGYAGFDRWFAQDLNNAHLASVSLYNQYVPAFQALLKKHGDDLRAFYRAVEELSQLPREERIASLESLQSPEVSQSR